MNDFTKQEIAISVDLKKHRIRVYRTTLMLLGYPKYIQLLVNPNSMMIAIRGVDKKSRDSHRVNLSILQTDNSYELYSTQLIDKLCELLYGLDVNFTYKLTGEYFENANIAVFSLKTMKKITPLEIIK